MVAQPNINQFAQTPFQGQLDLLFGGDGVIGATVDSTLVTPLVPGQAVKLSNTAGGPPVVTADVDGDDTFGFVTYNVKDQNYPAGAAVEIALSGCAMYMTAQAAINRGDAVELDTADLEVTTALGFNPPVGYALDKALNAGDLIRVLIQTKYGSQPLPDVPRVKRFTATLAQINAGLVLIPGIVGKQIIVETFVQRVTGGFATTTSVELESDVTAVAVETTAVAGLTNGAILVPGSANVTLGAGFGEPLPSGEGLKVVNNGSAATGGTSIDFDITYKQF